MSIIFEPKRINQLEVKNRLMRSATAERLVDKNGAVTDDLVSYYELLAKGGVGTIVTGYTAVDSRGRSGWQMMAIDNDNLITGLQRLTKIVHKYDTKILVQLNHCGRYSAGALIGTNPLAVSVEQPPESPFNKGGIKGGCDEYPPKEATDKEIKETIKSFVDATYRARESGFDGVQIHSAHGYLVSQFLSPRTNKRTDEWGGSMPDGTSPSKSPVGAIGNRSRFLMEIIKQIRQRLGNDFPVWLKMNCEDFLEPVRNSNPQERKTVTGSYPDYSSGMEDGLTLNDSIQVIKYLISSSAQPDALEISGGVGFDKVIRKDILKPEQEAYFLPQAEVFRKTYLPAEASAQAGPELPLILVGGIRSREIIEKVLGEKKMDLVAMSRPFIRNPNFPSHLKKGEGKSTCISCNLCLGMKKEPIKCRADENVILSRR